MGNTNLKHVPDHDFYTCMQSQAAMEIGRMRATWQAWDEQAEQQASLQRKTACNNGRKRMEDGGFVFESETLFPGRTPQDQDSRQQRDFRRRPSGRLSDKQIDEMRVRCLLRSN